MRCRKYCEQNGLMVADVFREVHNGVALGERSEFMKMRARYLQGEVDGVVVDNFSRLARGMENHFLLTQEMQENNIRLFCVSEKEGDNSYVRVSEGEQRERLN